MSRTFLGQNFLIDESIQKRIVDLFEPHSSLIGEIGPGEGAITQWLVQRFPDVLLFEKDKNLVRKHRESFGERVIEGDFAEWNFEINHETIKSISLVGNLPYEAGSRILKHVAEHASQVSDFLFMLQKEVVERIAAHPRSSEMGSLTVLLQGQFEIESLDVIPPEAFNPPPRVLSQLVRGSCRESGRHPLTENFQKFVQKSFLNKRKTLRNNWKGLFKEEVVAQIYKEQGWPLHIRAEELAVDDWPKLFERLCGER